MTEERRNGEMAEAEPLEEPMRTLARQYHEPPAAPREEMWSVIASHRNSARAESVEPLLFRRSAVPSFRRRAFRIGAGIAALLLLGIGIGRMTAPRSAAPAVAEASMADDPSAVAFELAAGRHLERSETFLTLFRASVQSGGSDEFSNASARELLMSNRLLLDSPASDDPRVRRLLEDLELVLAQIAQLPAEGTRADAGLITDGMEAGSMLPRLRSVTSEGVAATLRQGAL